MTTWHKYATHLIEAIVVLVVVAGLVGAGRAAGQTASSAGVPGWVLALAAAAPAGAVARLGREANGTLTRYRNWRDARLEAAASRTPNSDDIVDRDTSTQPLAAGAGPEVQGPTESDGIPDDEGRTQDQDHDDRNGRNGIDLSGNDIEDGRRSHGATSGSARDQTAGDRHRGRFVAGDNHARFWAKVDKSHDPAGCWTWTGGLTDDGYGRFRVVIDGQARHVKAHRWAYEAANGPIGDGLTVDHDDDRCRNRACVRPDHLEAVPLAENIRRAAAWRRANADSQEQDQ